MVPKSSNIPHQEPLIISSSIENIENSLLGILQEPNANNQNVNNYFPGSDTFKTISPSFDIVHNENIPINNGLKENYHADYGQKEKIFKMGIPPSESKFFCPIKPNAMIGNHSISPANGDTSFQMISDDCEDSDGDSYPRSEKRNGRRKIKIEFIEDRSKRNITFSKRRAGIMKKVLSFNLTIGIRA